MKYLFVVLCCISISCFAQNTFQQLDHAFNQFSQDSSYQDANISFTLIDIASGKILFEKNKDLALAPASTLKTYTTATALHVLGANYTYQTRIAFKGSIKNKIGEGDIIIYASGDPSFGSDRFPETHADLVLKQISFGLHQLGIERVKGSIKIVSNIFTDEGINTGWLDEDIGNYYGAGIYPLNWRENKFEINLVPTATSFEVSSNSAGYDNAKDFCIELIHKDGATTEEAFAFVEKTRPCMYAIRGVLSNKEKIQNMQMARLHPDDDFKRELIAFLKREFQFEQQQVSALSDEKTIATISSPPLSKLVYWCNQKSLNLYAEALCKTIAVKLFHKGTWPLGLAGLIRFASQRDINTKPISLKDGCGLAPENRITTYILASMLRFNTTEKWFPVFYESLPSINGLIMKSGYIGGTRSYAGYITLKDGRKASFAFIVHNYSNTPREVKLRMFQLLDMLK